CGGSAPAHVQGRNLAGTISTGEAQGEDGAFMETGREEIGLRTTAHTYGIRIDTKTGRVLDDRAGFYDLRTDPYQMANLRNSVLEDNLAAGLRDRVLSWHYETPWMHSGSLV
ncbi:MAG: hypothetical protein OXD39_07270, partial [Gemmatimonadetes bacterium]|nr:hypothetical protein [Gemmatimonadota bacterium]